MAEMTQGQAPAEFVDPFVVADEEPAAEATPEAAATAEEPPPSEEESFINPADLPPELKAHWKRMHGTYAKKMGEIKQIRQNAEAAQRFYNDPAFAEQTVRAWAQQNGYSLGRGGEPQQTQAAPSVVTQNMQQKIESELGEEFRWMAPMFAKVMNAVLPETLKPLEESRRALEQRTQAEQQQRMEAEYEALAEQLSEIAPDWETHEDDMSELLAFLRGNALTHKKYGSKLALLHGLVTRDVQATARAAQRMRDAVFNRTPTSTVRTKTAPNLSEQIRKAKTSNEAWDLAAQSALQGTGA